MKIAVLLTSFNRRETTVKCLRGLPRDGDLTLKVYLTDDRSTDGTADAVRAEFPDVVLLNGSGSDFWAGGMRRSFAEAMKSDFDYYLWLNDDSDLDRGFLRRMVDAAESLSNDYVARIIVGNFRSSDGSQTTYGGVIFPSWWRRTTPVIVYSNKELVRCESFNGNCVLISAQAVERVGNIDTCFTHGLGDFDYGSRATALGVPIFVLPGYVGACDRNPPTNTHLDDALPLSRRWQLVRGTKAYPPRPWAVFTRRHCGPLWFLYWLFPYVRVFLSGKLKKAPATKVIDSVERPLSGMGRRN